MSGKRKVWTGTEEEYRIQHEREMRIRFMQTDIPGITPPELQVEHIWQAQKADPGPEYDEYYVERPVSVPSGRELSPVRTYWASVSAPTAAVNSMPVAAMAAMRPWAVQATQSPVRAQAAQTSIKLLAAAATAEHQERWDEEVDLLAEAIAPSALPTPAAPPAWYQRTSRDLVARLEKAGFIIQKYDPQSHIIELRRGDGSKATLLLSEGLDAHVRNAPSFAHITTNEVSYEPQRGTTNNQPGGRAVGIRPGNHSQDRAYRAYSVRAS